MANALFFGAVTKNGRIFVETSQRAIKAQIQENNIARHNVLIYACQQKGGDGKIKRKQLNRKKVNFKPNSVHLSNLTEACNIFVGNQIVQKEKGRILKNLTKI